MHATQAELLSLVAALAHGPTTTVHHMRAKALIAGVCKEHADLHAGDLAESLLGND